MVEMETEEDQGVEMVEVETEEDQVELVDLVQEGVVMEKVEVVAMVRGVGEQVVVVEVEDWLNLKNILHHCNKPWKNSLYSFHYKDLRMKN